MGKVKVAVVAAALIAVIGAPSLAGAQQPVPTVAVSASPAGATFQPTGPLPSGPTRFEARRQGSKDVNLYFGLLNAGVTRQEFETAFRNDRRDDGDTALGLVSIQASVFASKTPRSVTFTLKPNQEYLVLVEEDSEDAPGQYSFTTLQTTGAWNGARATAPSATVRMVGLRFRGAANLPRNGTVRLINQDGQPHIVIAFPLRPRTTNAQLGRALRSPDERVFNRLLAGPPTPVLNLLSGGGLINDTQVQFQRPGRYALVCFIANHHLLGMHRIVTVQ